MKPYVVKNMMKNVLHFLAYNHSFVIQDDAHNCLELFLVELNRLRQMIGLQPFVVEKIIKSSNGNVQRRFSLSKPRDEAEETKNIEEVKIPEPVAEPIPPELVNVRITKSKFVPLMEELFGDNLIMNIESILDKDLNKNVRETQFYIGDVCIGRWANNQGRYTKN